MRKKGVGEITLYTLSECKFCQAIKGALTQLRIPFKDIDVEKNELAGDHIEMKLQTPCLKPTRLVSVFSSAASVESDI